MALAPVRINEVEREGFEVRSSTEKHAHFIAFPIKTVVCCLCAGCAPLLFGGCAAKPSQQTYPVTGIVKWNDGKPATELAQSTITLSGKGSEGPSIPVNPRGQVQADGTFVLQTYDPGDGAPAGKYLASVTYSYPSRLRDTPLQSLPIEPRFQSCLTSGLEVTIKPEKNELLLTVERAKH